MKLLARVHSIKLDEKEATITLKAKPPGIANGLVRFLGRDVRFDLEDPQFPLELENEPDQD